MNLWEAFNKLNKLYDSKKQINEAISYPAAPLSSSEKAEQSDALLEWKNAPSGKRVFLRKDISNAYIQKVIKDSGTDVVKLNKLLDLHRARYEKTSDKKLLDKIEKEIDEIRTDAWIDEHTTTLIYYLLGENCNNWVVFEKEFFTDDPLKAEIFDRYEDTAYSACSKVKNLLLDNGIWHWYPLEADKNNEIVKVYPYSDNLDEVEAGDYLGEFKLTRLRLQYHYELDEKFAKENSHKCQLIEGKKIYISDYDQEHDIDSYVVALTSHPKLGWLSNKEFYIGKEEFVDDVHNIIECVTENLEEAERYESIESAWDAIYDILDEAENYWGECLAIRKNNQYIRVAFDTDNYDYTMNDDDWGWTDFHIKPLYKRRTMYLELGE